jgi:hypothetical protein
MPSPRKTFDKADLLTFLTETDDEAAVGDFTVIRPSPTLFGETENSTHEVQAITEAFWCERYQLALVIQRARVTNGGANALPVHHPLAVAPGAADNTLARNIIVRHCSFGPDEYGNPATATSIWMASFHVNATSTT